jgi:hypothetical protein
MMAKNFLMNSTENPLNGNRRRKVLAWAATQIDSSKQGIHFIHGK